MNGAYLGHAFLPPALDGTLRFTNPGEEIVTLTWRGGGVSVAAGGVEHIDWPPVYDEGALTLDADGDVFVMWAASRDASTIDTDPGHSRRRHRRVVQRSFTYANHDNNPKRHWLHGLRLVRLEPDGTEPSQCVSDNNDHQPSSLPRATPPSGSIQATRCVQCVSPGTLKTFTCRTTAPSDALASELSKRLIACAFVGVLDSRGKSTPARPGRTDDIRPA